MKRFQALIVDDERPARQRLRQLLKKQPAIEVIGECSNIVNIQSVKELYPHSHGDSIAVLDDGAELKLSRNYRSKIEVCLRHPL